MNENKRKPVVGEKLFLLCISRRTTTQTDCTVIASGPKYFKVKRDDVSYDFSVQFHQSTWVQKTEYAPDFAVYENAQEYIEEVEHAALKRKISSEFYNRNGSNFTLSQLRAVDAILFPKAPTEGDPCTSPA